MAVLIKERILKPRLEGGEKQMGQACDSPMEGTSLERSKPGAETKRARRSGVGEVEQVARSLPRWVVCHNKSN